MKTAVFLMNLGGPRSLEEVEPYLYQLFSDPLVVSAPFGPLRPLVATPSNEWPTRNTATRTARPIAIFANCS